MALAERFFGFANFSALQMADFEGDFFERRAEYGQRIDPGSMAVSGDDLRGDRGRFQRQPLADFLLGLGSDVAEGADGSGNFADAQILRRIREARDVAQHLVIPQSELEAEGNRLGMNAVGAADLHGVFEFMRAAVERDGQRLRRFYQ